MRRDRWVAPLGDLAQQRAALRLLRDADIVYAPRSQRDALLLRCLRGARLIRTPIVCVVHHPLRRAMRRGPRSLLVQVALRGTDAFACVTAAATRQLNGISAIGGRAAEVHLGPQADFYPAGGDEGRGVIAAGITHRDMLTFARAAARTSVPATIICPRLPEGLGPGDLADNVTARFGTNALVDFPHLLSLYAVARVIAVPLLRVETQCGWWGLLDALGMGKPVIMTRTPLIDIDVETEGIGRWVDYGDVDGWREAIEWFDAHPKEAVLMGRRARALVDGGRTSRAFAHEIMDLFDRVLGVDTVQRGATTA